MLFNYFMACLNVYIEESSKCCCFTIIGGIESDPESRCTGQGGGGREQRYRAVPVSYPEPVDPARLPPPPLYGYTSTAPPPPPSVKLSLFLTGLESIKLESSTLEGTVHGSLRNCMCGPSPLPLDKFSVEMARVELSRVELFFIDSSPEPVDPA